MALITDLHRQFVADVAEGRKMPLEAVEKLADGRAFTGRQAQEVGLVDKLGGLEMASDTLRKMAKLSDKAGVLEGPEKKIPLLPRLLGASLSALGQALTEASPDASGQNGMIFQFRQ
jgi:protease-4